MSKEIKEDEVNEERTEGQKSEAQEGEGKELQGVIPMLENITECESVVISSAEDSEGSEDIILLDSDSDSL